jgi:Na+-translocating ferredoxin:NAD+ oxidoreductase RnfE subunit
MLLAVMAPGGFIIFGLILGIVNAVSDRISAKKGARA